MSNPWHWNFFFDKYPYTDFHELNLDWLLGSIKHWYREVEYLREAIATGSEDHNKYYETAHSTGDLIWWNGQFYRLTKNVSAGDDIDCHSLEHISVEDLLDEEAAARKAADDQLQKNIDAEASARKSADSAEADAREAADTALGQRVDKEITDRTNADAGLQAQITSNDTDIANLQSCCQTVQNTISNHETRITTNTTNIANLTKQIEEGTNPSGVKDTNTLTQLTYHRWVGQTYGGDTGITQATAMVELYNKVKAIEAAGGNGELCRMQLYGRAKGSSDPWGLATNSPLNATSEGYEVNTVDNSIIAGDFSVVTSTFASTVDVCETQSWYYTNSDGKFTWTQTKNPPVPNDDLEWQYRLIYQTADYIDAT